MTPLVEVVEIQGERLMGLAEGSGLDHGIYGAPALKRKVTSAY